jgi:hypothetical protein
MYRFHTPDIAPSYMGHQHSLFLFNTHCVPDQKRTPIPADHSTQRGLCEVSVARRSVPTILSIHHTLACQYSSVFAVFAMQAHSPTMADLRIEVMFRERRAFGVRATALSEPPRSRSLRSSFFPSPTTERGWTANVDSGMVLTRVPELLI